MDFKKGKKATEAANDHPDNEQEAYDEGRDPGDEAPPDLVTGDPDPIAPLEAAADDIQQSHEIRVKLSADLQEVVGRLIKDKVLDGVVIVGFKWQPEIEGIFYEGMASGINPHEDLKGVEREVEHAQGLLYATPAAVAYEVTRIRPAVGFVTKLSQMRETRRRIRTMLNMLKRLDAEVTQGLMALKQGKKK